MTDHPSWRAKLEAALREQEKTPQARYVQLATARPDARPAVRTLVFRSFLDPDHRLIFTADLRSAKREQLRDEERMEACWYFADSREQFRIGGRGVMLAADGDDQLTAQARRRIWDEMSEDSRQTFTWPQPGAPLAATSEFERAVPDDPPPHFALLLITPEEVDHLELKARPHRRTLYRLADDRWVSESVNP